MSDLASIPALVQFASNNSQLQSAQYIAAQRLLNYDGEIYPSDGCAITLSVLMQENGIPVPDTFMAFDLANLLLNGRGWVKIPVGQQTAGDVATTCGIHPQHGVDHIYLVLRSINQDEMIIADNQDTQPHFRFASGLGGKSPTRYFLRAT